jgi:hypothetical protein
LSWGDDGFQRLTVSFLYQKYTSDIKVTWILLIIFTKWGYNAT